MVAREDPEKVSGGGRLNFVQFYQKRMDSLLMTMRYNETEVKRRIEPWPGGPIGWSVVLYTKRLWVRFSVRAHT